jgi:hypothetical protein
LAQQLAIYLAPLLIAADELLDKRLVRTLLQTVQVILMFRDRVHGLLLSELGRYLLGAEHGPAGTKRLGNLIRSPKWTIQLVHDFLWKQADAVVQGCVQQGLRLVASWDDSELEKPASVKGEGLAPVRSAQATRLQSAPPRTPPPASAVRVNGLQWMALLLIPLCDCLPAGLPPTILAFMNWWSSAAPCFSFRRDEQVRLLRQCAQCWGKAVIHVFDRGYASALWIGALLGLQLDWVLRWRGDYRLLDSQKVSRISWRILLGKKGWQSRWVWDRHRGKLVQCSVLATQVFHPQYPDVPLYLVVSRWPGRHPWYLLTNEPVTSVEQAWEIVRIYHLRWQIELVWRFDKSELGFQSPRVWDWENRLKLLALATLAYAFLLSLMQACWELLRLWLLRQFAHQTGLRAWRVRAPLYRLRQALSWLWLHSDSTWYRPRLLRVSVTLIEEALPLLC